MTDATSRETLGEVIDLTRLARPEADAFRHIAEVLGARYAGDEAEAPRNAGSPPLALPSRTDEPVRHDDAVATLLETLPLPILVTEREGVAFLNRAARATLGYDTAQALAAAGGLATLFGGQRAADGAVPVSDAAGRTFQAKVEMTPIDWAGHRAILVSLQPLPERADGDAPVTHAGSDALRALLGANPDPIAIITRGGRVETANGAYERLGSDEDLSLEARLDAAALETILLATAEAFAASDGATASVLVGARPMTVTVGIVPDTEVACLVFHHVARETQKGEPDADWSAGHALERAAERAQRLLGEAKVEIKVCGGPVPSLEKDLAEEAECFFRAALVTIGARVPMGTIVTVERREAGYVLSLAPADGEVLAEIGRSARLVLYALEAGLALAPAQEDGLTIAPLVTRAPKGSGAA